MKKFSGLLVFLFSQFVQAQAQEHEFLAFINVNVVNESVFVDFEMKAGATCFGINLFRSKDSVNFEKIDEIPGVCGSPDEPIRYSFTDNKPPKNIPIYYQLEFGADGVSLVHKVKVVEFLSERYTVLPNPINESSMIYFENPINEKTEIFFYNAMGNFLFKQQTNGNKHAIDHSRFESGISFFTIRFINGSNGISGKFVKW